MKILQISILAFLLMSCETRKVAYVENTKVFEEFNATIEMKSRNEAIIKDRKLRLDSLSVSIYNAENFLNDPKMDNESKESIMSQYIYQKTLYDSLGTELRLLMNELEYNTISKSWTEINKYLKEYGEKKKYDMIHGVSGDGNLMYAKEDLNITDDVINFINNRYEGE